MMTAGDCADAENLAPPPALPGVAAAEGADDAEVIVADAGACFFPAALLAAADGGDAGAASSTLTALPDRGLFRPVSAPAAADEAEAVAMPEAYALAETPACLAAATNAAVPDSIGGSYLTPCRCSVDSSLKLGVTTDMAALRLFSASDVEDTSMLVPVPLIPFLLMMTPSRTLVAQILHILRCLWWAGNTHVEGMAATRGWGSTSPSSRTRRKALLAWWW